MSTMPNDFYTCAERQEAEEAGYALVQALETLGVLLTDTEIMSPCVNCSPNAGYRINLGNVRADEAREMTRVFRDLAASRPKVDAE
ncbi:hypothetical protein AB0I16_00200 [Streptomyces sp. NPDC050703]|uniref:hypothetical protein n=1 Tax=Streptomyces sp. NPDC050703 TaxID=3157218 RepID=UPI0034392E4E